MGEDSAVEVFIKSLGDFIPKDPILMLEPVTPTGTLGRLVSGRRSGRVQRSLVAAFCNIGASVSDSPMCIA